MQVVLMLRVAISDWVVRKGLTKEVMHNPTAQ